MATLDYNFVTGSYDDDVGTGRTFSNAVTFSRASDATMVNSSGQIVTVSSNVARVGHHVYNGSTWENKGLLVESQARTNLIRNGDLASNWLAIRSTVTGGQPNTLTGANDAIAIVPDTSNNTHIYIHNGSVASVTLGNTYTYSVFVKADGYNGVRLYGANGVACDTIFDLATGTVQSLGTGDVASIEDFDNGVYRCSVTFVANQTNSGARPYIGVTNNSFATSFSGDGTSGIEAAFAQLEEGDTLSSYIPTSGSQVTRAAESASAVAVNVPNITTGFSSVIKSEITLSDKNLSAQSTLMEVGDYSIILDTSSTGELVSRVVSGGNQDSSIAFTSTGINQQMFVGMRASANNVQIALAGSAGAANTSLFTLPSTSSDDLSIVSDFAGTIQSIKVVDSDIGESQLETETDPNPASATTATPTSVSSNTFVGSPQVTLNSVVQTATPTSVSSNTSVGSPEVNPASNAIIFDGANLHITLPSIGSFDTQTDIYSAWKEWIRLSDNAKYPPAFDTTGGDSVGSGQNVAPYFFCRNDLGWRIKMPSEDGEIVVSGNLFPRDPNTSLFEQTSGFDAFLRLEVSTRAVVIGLDGLDTINRGVQKASLLIPHTENL